jgi:hypothetical protein
MMRRFPLFLLVAVIGCNGDVPGGTDGGAEPVDSGVDSEVNRGVDSAVDGGPRRAIDWFTQTDVHLNHTGCTEIEVTNNGVTAKYVYYTAAATPAEADLLYVLLPGTNSTPKKFTCDDGEGDCAAEGVPCSDGSGTCVGSGYCNHVVEMGDNVAPGERVLAVAISYYNERTVNGICLCNDACYADTRFERIQGDPEGLPAGDIASSLDWFLREVGAEDAFTGCAEAPCDTGLIGDGGQTCSEKMEDICWGKTIVAGGSQGGGMALMIGKLKRARRVVQFNSTSDKRMSIRERDGECDYVGDVPPDGWTPEPAAWISYPGQTPPQDVFAFVCESDANFEAAGLNFDIIGLPDWTEYPADDVLGQRQTVTGPPTGFQCGHGAEPVLNPTADLRFANWWHFAAGLQE